jgi:hypothetical protein
MKLNLLKLMITTIIGAHSVISHAGFLDDIDGNYLIKGKSCIFDSSTKLTGEARIDSSDIGAVLSLEVFISNYKTEIPFSFLNGKGNKKETQVEGDIVPLPVTRRVIWETDEAERTSTKSEFKGVLVTRKTSTTTLVEVEDDKLLFKLNNIECELVRK